MATLLTNGSSSPAAASPASAPRLTTTHALGIALVVLGIACWPTLVSMVHVWNTSDTYAHGWLIAPISLYLLVQLRAQLTRIDTQPAWWALPWLALAGAGWLLAVLADVQVVQQLMFVTLALGLTLLVMGRAWCTAAMFPLGFLYLAVPLGDGLTPHLIDMTADFVVYALRLTGIPVYREGTFFVIPSGNWSVVSGCSGMRYLMATITVGVLFAYLNYRSLGRRVAFVGIAIAVSIVANWLRAYGIVMIAHLSGMKLALGVDHYIYGWVFFGLVIFLLMSIGMLWSEPPAEAPHDTEDLVRRGDQGFGARHAAALAAGLAVLAVWPVAARIASAPVPHPAPVLPTGTTLPDSWREAALPVPDWRPHFVGTPALLHRAFERDGRTVGLFIAWYGTQSQGDELVHAANELVREKYEPWRRLRTAPRSGDVGPWGGVTETLLQQRSGVRQIVVWQSNWTFGRYSTGRLETKLLETASRLRGYGNPAAAVLVYTIPRDEGDLDASRAALSTFADALLPPVTAALARAAGMEH
ncbi:MAG: exosortase A [Gammaproteobacteria bacterium]